MATIRDLLERLRPAAVPGAATAAGVPADQRARLEAELAPVFAVLERVDAGCAAVRATASAEADRIRTATAEAEAAALGQARAQAPAEQASAAAAVQRDAEAELAAITSAARARTQRLHQELERRLPQLVAEVVTRVRAELLAVIGSTTREGHDERAMGGGDGAGPGDGASSRRDGGDPDPGGRP